MTTRVLTPLVPWDESRPADKKPPTFDTSMPLSSGSKTTFSDAVARRLRAHRSLTVGILLRREHADIGLGRPGLGNTPELEARYVQRGQGTAHQYRVP